MRLIIPIEYYRLGGVERVIVSLIREISDQIDQVILIIPPQKISYFQNLLPPSDSIIYESFQLPNQKSFNTSMVGLGNKLLTITKQLNCQILTEKIEAFVSKYRSQAIINYSIKKYQATHCLYILTNCLIPPQLDIPLAMISHDIYWHFAPLTYPDDYVKRYDQNLLTWLKNVDLVFTVSQKTAQDILSLYPEFKPKIKPVCNAGYLREDQIITNDPIKPPEAPITFYFPSSFGIYKDHLTLLKAGVKLAQKGRKFKIILTGKQTDSLVQGKLDLSQQLETQEYLDYLDQCQQLYQNNQEIFSQYIEGFGYVESSFVETCYQSCDCVIIPSKYEGFGLALSEAIVRGLPVIASDLDVFSEQVELYLCSDRVIFFPQGDEDSLADYLENFLNNPIPKLSQQEVNQRFSHWTWKEAAKEYIASLNQLNLSMNH